MSVIDSQWAEVAEERKIEGVPEGWRIVRLLEDTIRTPNVWQGNATVVLERIPKPKRRILMAEAEVPPDFRIEDGGDWHIYVCRSSGLNLSADRFLATARIEERDA